MCYVLLNLGLGHSKVWEAWGAVVKYKKVVFTKNQCEMLDEEQG
jgi:hypothetical protein